MNANTILGPGVYDIEKIKGDGWDIDAKHIELNGVNAEANNRPKGDTE